ncbi:MAG: hypothetical protein ACOZNI_28220, partial [Myxococcota bacterium]
AAKPSDAALAARFEAEAAARREREAIEKRASESAMASPFPERGPTPGTQSRCVPDLIADAARRFGFSAAELPTLSTYFVRQTPDLDGDGDFDDVDADGRAEWVVQATCGALGACEQALYLSNGECLVFAARYVGHVLPKDTRKDGYADLEVRQPTDCNGRAAIITDFAWSQGRYAEVGGVTCTCPGKGTRPDRCPQ